MQFIENKGQWDDRVKYRGDFSSGAFFLQEKGFRVLMQNTDDLQKLSEYLHGHTLVTAQTDKITLHSNVYDVEFVGANSNPRRTPDKMLQTYNNYFLGNDPTKWKGDCKIYQAVTYENVYPNIDVRYYSNSGNLKYDLVVKPGGKIE